MDMAIWPMPWSSLPASNRAFSAWSARGIDGFGITNSYWKDEDSIRAWKAVVSHAAAQKLGRERWYEDYQVRIARVERAYGFER